MGCHINDMTRSITHIIDMSLALKQEKHLNNMFDYTTKHKEYGDYYIINDNIKYLFHQSF